jgi:parvulin-like peptidyl-prolyl isomerase
MLAQAVVAKLDTDTNQQAASTLAQLKSGTDFATLAGQVSEDQSTKGNGGQYNGAINRNNADVPAQVMQQLFKLQPGQTSEVINTGFSLEIIKVNSVQDGSVQASHIVFDYKPIGDYIAPLKAKNKPQNLIKV